MQAQATQEANRAATNRWPPFWAIAAMVLLGFDEFVAVLYNPLWLLLGLVIFLFGKTVYQASTSGPSRCVSLSITEMQCEAKNTSVSASNDKGMTLPAAMLRQSMSIHSLMMSSSP